MSPPRKLFAERLRLLRERHQLTQDELGKRISRSQNTISQWEAVVDGTWPTVPDLAQLCAIFAVSADYLTGAASTETGLSPARFLVDLRAWRLAVPGSTWWVQIPEEHEIVTLERLTAMIDDAKRRGKNTHENR